MTASRGPHRGRHARPKRLKWRAVAAACALAAALALPTRALTTGGGDASGHPPAALAADGQAADAVRLHAAARAAVAFSLRLRPPETPGAQAASTPRRTRHHQAPAAKPPPPSPAAKAAARATNPTPSGVGAVIAFVKAQLGKAYVMGATGPDAYDCSGLVQAAFRTIGVDLPRVSESQSTAGTQVSLNDLKPGDILYWGSAGNAYHVAVYIGGGNFIGAQNPSTGVVERPLSFSPPDGAVRIL